MLNLRQIPLSWATRQASGAIASGLSLDDLFDRALITPQFGDDRDLISPLQLLVFYAGLVLETDDSTHSMVRDRLEPVSGPLGLRMLFGGANLGDGLLALARFYQISSRTIRLQLSTEGAQAFLAVQVEDSQGRGRDQEDIQLTYLYLGLTSYLGRSFPVGGVTTRDPEHFNLGAAHYVMDAPVKLGSRAGMAFSKGLLALPPPKARIEDFNWAPVREALDVLETSAHPVMEPNSHDLRLDRVAAQHMMAPSTFRRRMAQTGSGFRQVRDRILLDATLERLGAGSFSLEAIAAELGYADARNLRRFVKRVTGRTPNDIRQELTGSVSSSRLRARLQEILGLMSL